MDKHSLDFGTSQLHAPAALVRSIGYEAGWALDVVEILLLPGLKSVSNRAEYQESSCV
jgi:hypothetical protein